MALTLWLFSRYRPSQVFVMAQPVRGTVPFAISNEQIGTLAHVVIQKNSRVEILGAKVFVKWDEGKDTIGLGVGDDIWVKIRVDGKEGWIHTDEDLQAIGLYQAG